MLEIRGLEKSYGTRRILRGVDLEISAGQVVALLGPNGAGKTTLVSIVAGLREPDRGVVKVGGIDALRHPGRARSLIGLAPQDLGVYPTLTARDNLAFFARLAGVDRRRVGVRIEEVAEALQLHDLLDRRAGLLSGGQKRRLHTAMALLHRPQVLFLDEPTVGADVESRRQVLKLVSALAADGVAVCYATHYLLEVEELEARVAILDGGRIVASGTVSELTRRHGISGLRLVFDGDAPPLAGFTRNGSEAVLETDEPGQAAASTIGALGAAASSLVSVEMFRPSLETAYLALTGGERDQDEGVAHVA
jgi:ABC-2 type transport system ATP-binding protein